MGAYFEGFARTFDYSGRSTRGQFWLFQVCALLVNVVALLAIGMLWPTVLNPDGPDAPTVALWVLHGVPGLALLARRLHDAGRSARWLTWIILPGIGWLVLLFMSFAAPDDDENEYGPNPREPVRTTAGRDVRHEPALANGRHALPVAELEKLQALKASGAIDDEEFATLKAKVLGRGAR